ncbi:MAG: hypothetical protein AVDCRST_MAG85-1779 [uncultured Solirubrobacteraceae bacterium]|uniref:Uncharacterized protein n=1 Tax=uncultured Solirubrobacteraceae bacterium TaxID=1162706 RepID=A0A6J4SJM0_9ACTN|nr:MAG: hypothetical protein AVDCRST_MAG85-1779 [uncultured Solirubrobacteraceae bacterium]
MLRTRRFLCLLALILALPSAAFAQGAGDDQYQDPFGDEPTQQQDPGDGGIGDDPPGDGGGSGNGGSGNDNGGGGTGGDGKTGNGGGTGGGQTTPRPDPDALPMTGSDPRPLLFIGAAFLLGGIGLRLRTIDPNDF